MAESRTSKALDDLLDAVAGDIEDKGLIDNAEARLEEYQSAAEVQLDRAGDLLRNALARLVQEINQRYPALTREPEVQEAVDALSDPTPVAKTEAQARHERDEADRVRAEEANKQFDE
jgi:hypothetical protein